MNNVIDFRTRLPAADQGGPPPKADPYAEAPWLIVEFYDAPHMRIRGKTDLTPNGLREAARTMISAAIGMLNNAYLMDRDADHLPRMMVQLFHTGRLAVDTFNPKTDNGDPLRSELEWMKKALPHVGNILDDLKSRAHE